MKTDNGAKKRRLTESKDHVGSANARNILRTATAVVASIVLMHSANACAATGTMNIQTTPAGVKYLVVSAAGMKKVKEGVSPYYDTKFPVGTYKICFQRDGYIPVWQDSVVTTYGSSWVGPAMKKSDSSTTVSCEDMVSHFIAEQEVRDASSADADEVRKTKLAAEQAEQKAREARLAVEQAEKKVRDAKYALQQAEQRARIARTLWWYPAQDGMGGPQTWAYDSTHNAAYGHYDIGAFCKKYSSGSYMIEESCRNHEAEARDRISHLSVAPEIMNYCNKYSSESYSILETCIENERSAKNRIR